MVTVRPASSTGSVDPVLWKKIQKAIDQYVACYHRRIPWIDAEEMRNEAMVDVMGALSKGLYDPENGQPAKAYFARIARNAIMRFCLASQSPVHAPTRQRESLVEATAGRVSFEQIFDAPFDPRSREVEAAVRPEGHWTQAILDDGPKRVAILSRILQITIGTRGEPWVRAMLAGQDVRGDEAMKKSGAVARKLAKRDPVLQRMVERT